MKKTLLFIGVLMMAACGPDGGDKELNTDDIKVNASADGKTNEDLPEMTFSEDEFDFGMITQGEKVSHAFIFKNTGKTNLIISGASGSCGCTVPEWSKEPIEPGKEGKINVVFNSEGKRSKKKKTVTIVTNCEPATRVVRIKAEIVVAETAK